MGVVRNINYIINFVTPLKRQTILAKLTNHKPKSSFSRTASYLFYMKVYSLLCGALLLGIANGEGKLRRVSLYSFLLLRLLVLLERAT